MRSIARGLLGVALASSVSLRAADTVACGGSIEGPVYINTRNPDLPLSRFASGRVGVVGPWETSFRVVAYRLLAETPLSDAETTALVGFERSVHRMTDPRMIDPAVAVADPSGDRSDASLGAYLPDDEPWRAARRSSSGRAVRTSRTGGRPTGAWTPNCLGDAFRSAAVALRQRVAHYGPRSDAARAWVEAQDAVFSNCGPTPGRGPIALQAAAPEEQRRDRAYQIAAADFYAGRYDAAERALHRDRRRRGIALVDAGALPRPAHHHPRGAAWARDAGRGPPRPRREGSRRAAGRSRGARRCTT